MRTWFITGASRGFGSLIAERALRAGGAPMNTHHYDSNQYTVLGHSEASATGLMLLGFIPIRQNSRFVRAQDAAIKAKGGDAMINTQVQERWFWAWVLNGYTTKVSGDVIKLKNVQ